MSHGGDFRFKGTDEFIPNFSFSSTTANTSLPEYGRSRPRLNKLRKPKSSFLKQGAADLAYNPFRNEEAGGKTAAVFGWRTDMTSVADGSTNEGSHDFEKVSVKVNDAPVSGNSSYFEFKSSKVGHSHEADSNGSVEGSSSFGVLPDMIRKLNLEGSATGDKEAAYSENFVSRTINAEFGSLNGSNEALLSKRKEHGCLQNRVENSNSDAASKTCSFDKNIENGIDCENNENVFLQEAIIENLTVFQKNSLPKNGGLFCSCASTSTSSSTCICDQDETSCTLKTSANGHVGEGFCFIGKFDAAISSNIKSSFNRKVKTIPKKHAGKQKQTDLMKKRNYILESREDPTCGREFAFKFLTPQHESYQPYSPMDVSPNPVNEGQHLNEASATSNEGFTLGGTFESPEKTTQDGNLAPDEHLAYATQQRNIDNKKGCAFVDVRKTPQEEFALESETESFKSATEDLELNTENTTSIASSCNAESDGTKNFYSDCNREETSGTRFIFTASPSSAKPAPVRYLTAINRSKGSNSYRRPATSEVFGAFSGGQLLKDPFQDNVKANSNFSQLKQKMDLSTSIEDQNNHKPSSLPETIRSTTVSQEACEKWRLRGNEAYTNGDLSKAEEYYTRGVRCIPKSEKSRGSNRSLMLCYSNRAATRMSLGRLREAVKDCKLATGIDPNFLRAHVRAANCYLALGEVEEALKLFRYCLQSGTGATVDRKILREASEGLQKAQKAGEAMSRSIESIHQGTCNDADDTLRSADEALQICLYSEKLLEIKAEALFVLQKYNRVIKLCQKTLDSAERNSNDTGVTGQYKNPNCTSLQGRLYFRFWRCRLTLKSCFFLGKLEEALALLEKHESLWKGSETLESLIPFVAVVRDLLRYKAAGNEAFQSENYAKAVEHYTSALTFNTDSHPFAAICLCNRAAAYKAQGKVIDSIADCNLAIALERDYLKAILRRAYLYESIRDYGQAAKDMELIVSLLKKQADNCLKKSQEKLTNLGVPIDLRQAQSQLYKFIEHAKKDTTLNMYLILDVKSSASASDIKKAYRQAALKHHPDKAGQILAKSNSKRDETWKEIAEDIQRDADRLFKLIGEAHTILSDPAQRSGYDAEEEIRNTPYKNREPFTSRTHFEEQTYPSYRTKSRRQPNNFWRSQGYY